jgi:hypothetical protein
MGIFVEAIRSNSNYFNNNSANINQFDPLLINSQEQLSSNSNSLSRILNLYNQTKTYTPSTYDGGSLADFHQPTSLNSSSNVNRIDEQFLSDLEVRFGCLWNCITLLSAAASMQLKILNLNFNQVDLQTVANAITGYGSFNGLSDAFRKILYRIENIVKRILLLESDYQKAHEAIKRGISAKILAKVQGSADPNDPNSVQHNLEALVRNVSGLDEIAWEILLQLTDPNAALIDHTVADWVEAHVKSLSANQPLTIL